MFLIYKNSISRTSIKWIISTGQVESESLVPIGSQQAEGAQLLPSFRGEGLTMKKHHLQPDGEERQFLNLYCYVRIGHNTYMQNFVSSKIIMVTIVFIKIPLSICSSIYQTFKQPAKTPQSLPSNQPERTHTNNFCRRNPVSVQLGISCEGESFASAKLL